MTIFYDPEYERLSELVSKYMLYDEKMRFIIPEDVPKEVYEAYKRKKNLPLKCLVMWITLRKNITLKI